MGRNALYVVLKFFFLCLHSLFSTVIILVYCCTYIAKVPDTSIKFVIIIIVIIIIITIIIIIIIIIIIVKHVFEDPPDLSDSTSLTPSLLLF